MFSSALTSYLILSDVLSSIILTGLNPANHSDISARGIDNVFNTSPSKSAFQNHIICNYYRHNKIIYYNLERLHRNNLCGLYLQMYGRWKHLLCICLPFPFKGAHPHPLYYRPYSTHFFIPLFLIVLCFR